MTLKSVLIIDDDKHFAGSLKTALGREDVDCAVAASATEASAKISQKIFDLIILDGELPDKNGMQWLEESRARLQDASVVFVSASWRDTESHKKLVRELGVNGIIHKPVSLDVLVDEALRLMRADAAPLDPMDNLYMELVPNYVAEITGEFQKMNNVLRYGPKDCSVDELKAMTMAAHKIRGTSGLFGFDEIGTIAGELESAFRRLNGDATLLDSPHCEPILALLTRASDELDRVHKISLDKQKALTSRRRHQARVATEAARRVVIVDDDRFFLKRIEHLLSSENIVLNSYSDAVHVMEAINEFKPALVVLDINMPGKSGLQICEELRRSGSTVPVLIMSADADSDTRDRADRAGANAFVVKPFGNAYFIKTVRGLIH